MSELSIAIPVAPMGKPRMTQRDRWAKRKCVVRYYAYKDEINAHIAKNPEVKAMIDSGEVDTLSWLAVLPIPKSWSKKKKAAHAGKIHRGKPDRDNIDKGILDALFKEDSGIGPGYLNPIWDDGKGARIELTLAITEGKEAV